MRALSVLAVAVVTLTLSACSGGSASVALPDALGDFQQHSALCDAFDGDTAQQCLDNAAGIQEVDDAAAASLSAAYDGAPAQAKSYATEGFAQMATVYAVGSDSPGLWSSRDSELWEERVGVHGERIVTDGAVECLTTTKQTVPISKEVPDGAWGPRECRASDGKKTVMVFPGSDMTVEQALTLTSDALAAL